MRQIILASQSPRRQELLSKMGVEFKVIPSKYDEKLDESRDIEEVAQELALGKALDVAKDYPDALVVGSDTIVGIGGRQLEKPVDMEDARQMLTVMAGQKSTASTGLALVCLNENIQIVDVDTANVYFKSNSNEVEKLREEYLASEDWKDKAGGYGIQSGAAPLIDRIEGDYDTIVGLPTQLLATRLQELGVALPR